MSAALPSQPAPSPRGRNPLPVEALQDHLGGLLREREALRATKSPLALERNRREIVRTLNRNDYGKELLRHHLGRFHGREPQPPAVSAGLWPDLMSFPAGGRRPGCYSASLTA